MEDYVYFGLLALIAEIIGTVSGFGSSILFVPIASLFFDFQSVLGITAVFHVFSNLSKIVLFRQGVNWKIVIELGIPAILFVILGALLTSIIPQKQLEAGMSVILILLAIYLIVRFNKSISATRQNLILGGSFSGFLAGLIGTGGALRGIVLTAFQLPKTVFVATSAFIDLGVDTSRAIVYISKGYFLSSHLIYLPILISVSILGSFIGKKILEKTSESIFRYLVLATIIITSVIQIVKYFTP